MIKWLIMTLNDSEPFDVDEITSLVENDDFHDNFRLINERIAEILHQKPRRTKIPSKMKGLYAYFDEQMRETVGKSYE